MSETGHVANGGAPEQPGVSPDPFGADEAPARSGFTFLDDEDDDVLLMPGPQSSWSEAAEAALQAHQAQEPQPSPAPGPHGVPQQGYVQEPAPQSQALPPQQPQPQPQAQPQPHAQPQPAPAPAVVYEGQPSVPGAPDVYAAFAAAQAAAGAYAEPHAPAPAPAAPSAPAAPAPAPESAPAPDGGAEPTGAQQPAAPSPEAQAAPAAPASENASAAGGPEEDAAVQGAAEEGTPIAPSWPPMPVPGATAPGTSEPGAAPVAGPPQQGAQAPAGAPAASRRPLHAGPAIPDPSVMTGQVPVRRLGDRGNGRPATPAHGVPVPGPEYAGHSQPGQHPTGPEYLDVAGEPVVQQFVPQQSGPAEETPAEAPADGAAPAAGGQPSRISAFLASPAPEFRQAVAARMEAAEEVAGQAEPGAPQTASGTGDFAVPPTPGPEEERAAAEPSAAEAEEPDATTTLRTITREEAAAARAATVPAPAAPADGAPAAPAPGEAAEAAEAAPADAAPAAEPQPAEAPVTEVPSHAGPLVVGADGTVETPETEAAPETAPAPTAEAAPAEPVPAQAEVAGPAAEAEAVPPQAEQPEAPQPEIPQPVDAGPDAAASPAAAPAPAESSAEAAASPEQPSPADAGAPAPGAAEVAAAEVAVEAAAGAAAATGQAAPGFEDPLRDAVHRVMRERRDIRNGFRPDPIPHDVLLRVLESAHTAPSVGYSQPWDFVVIRSAKTRKRMHELAMRQREAFAESLPKARARQFRELKIEAILDTPVNIVVTADRTRGGRHTLGRHTQPQMAPYSAALAVENLWLAARAEGLGVGWVSFFDEREMVESLGLPAHLDVIAYLCIGYVDEFPEEPELAQAGWAKKRPLSWVVHEEQYGNRVLPGEEPHSVLEETLRVIRPLDAKALGEAWDRQKRMTKPAGSLGMLEIISAQLCGLSRVCPPPVPEPAAVAVFAGDHGVHAQGVTHWPQEVTGQMVANFLAGGAVVNAFAGQLGAEVCVVDVGVASELPEALQAGKATGLLPRKVRPGTADMTEGPAMTREEAVQAIEVGIETARDLVAAGNKILLTGDMGIANTTAAAALISVFTGEDPAAVTGRGTGIDDEMHAHKVTVIQKALALHQPDPADPIGVLSAVGGLEHAATAGFLLGAASLRVPVILDGVIAGASALVARAIAPEVLAACIAGHRSAEPGHKIALSRLGLRPLVDLDLRLGEGTGALLALPLVQSAARAMHEVATFDSTGIDDKN